MSMPTSARRWAVRGSAAAVFLLAAGGGTQALASTQAGLPSAALAGAPVSNPYSPAYHHAYRHGVVPTRARAARIRAWASQHPAATPSASVHALSASDLNYGGGASVGGIGVTTGHEKVYLVFYGSQWGTQGTDSHGNVTLSGDPSGEAPYLQEFIRGLGTGGELWSGVMTQYCDGVATGAQSCPASNLQHVAYPTGGALAGVWVDESTASPATATAAQLGTEAVKAAGHFGNTTAAANRDAQYVIISPTGTNPDNWLTSGFCAWHDYNGDVGVSSAYGDIAFTNLPYLTDVGASCGQDFVNSSGTLDGVSIVEGHEYAETITDQDPPDGWTDFSGNETGDKCAWITPGTSGGSFDLKTSTGTFAVQTTWANDGSSGKGACEASHPIVFNGTGENKVTVTKPANQSSKRGKKVSLQIHATDSASGQTLTYHARGLPKGLSIKSRTGLISGTPTKTGTHTVKITVTDTTGASGSTSFSWKIHA
jgi:Putative Ig domain